MAFLLEPPQWLMMPTHFLGNRKREAYPGSFPRSPASRPHPEPGNDTDPHGMTWVSMRFSP